MDGDKMKTKLPDEWPPRFHCYVPGVFETLAKEGYGLVLAPLITDLNDIAKHAIETGDTKLIAKLKQMGIISDCNE